MDQRDLIKEVLISKKNYKDSIEEFLDVIERELVDEVVAVYVAGSFARDDYMPGRSDIDVYVVMKSDNEDIRKRLHKIAREITDKHLKEVKDYHPEPFSLAITTLNEAKSGRSWLGAGWEYHIFLREGKLLYGTDIKGLLQRPTQESEILKAREFLGKLKRDHEIYRLFSVVFRATSILLSLSGIYVAAKEDVVKEFKRAHPNEKDSIEALEKAYELWNIWAKGELTDKESLELFSAVLKVSDTISRLLKDCDYPGSGTPQSP